MIAIVIPYFKITFFKETLASLANQSNKDFHVYIGDDNSPEDPYPLINLYKSKFSLTYKKFDQNFGSISLVKHWERCISLTQNENWVMLLGDDDVLGSNVIEEFYRHVGKTENFINVIRFSSAPINEESKETWKVFRHPEYESSIDFFFRDRRSSLSEYIFTKDQILKKGFKDLPLAWCSDILAVLEFSNFGQVLSINSATVFIRQSEINISGKNDNLKEKNLASEKFLSYLLTEKQNHFSKKQRLKLLYHMEITLNKKTTISKKEYQFLFINYVRNFAPLPIIKFLRRITQRIINPRKF